MISRILPETRILSGLILFDVLVTTALVELGIAYEGHPLVQILSLDFYAFMTAKLTFAFFGLGTIELWFRKNKKCRKEVVEKIMRIGIGIYGVVLGLALYNLYLNYIFQL